MRKPFIVLACAVLFIAGGCGAAPKNPRDSKQQQPITSASNTPQTPRMDTAPQQSSQKSPNAALDPCATHLHDEVCAALLLYLSSHADHTPATLAELKQVLGFNDLDLSCPLSHQPYGYAIDGLIIPGEEARVLIYDSTPAHSGIRWGIRVTPRIAGRPPAATVIPMTAEMFSKLQQP